MSEQDEKNLRLAEKAVKRKDFVTALKYYHRAAENGIISAMLECGRMYFDGENGVEKDVDESMNWFKKASELGSATAMNNLGYIFWTLEMYDEAVLWYEQSARRGDVIAMLNLSDTYRKKLQKISEANYWLKKAASTKDATFIRKVAEYYAFEEVEPNHIDTAIKLYRKAIKLGDFEACRELGDLFFRLNDIPKAHEYYRDGANAGNVSCMTELGTLLIYIPNCFSPAHYWLNRAISRGNVYAMRGMGELYEEYKDYPNALRWYRKAILNGVQEVEEELPNIKKLLKKHKPEYKLKLRSVDD